jgi:TRAP-type C4-dicarboxylate transport system substrate-binding protein
MTSPIAIRFGGYQGNASVHTRGMRRFRDAMVRALGAAVDVQLTENVTAQGRRADDLFTMVESGELDLCYFASSYLVHRVPALGALDQPFTITDRQRAYAMLDGDVGAQLAEEVAAQTGYRVLAWWDNGFRHISNRLRPIRTPEDCRGIRLRTLDNAFHQRIFAALGFVPQYLDVKELVPAVEAERIDAQENPLTNLVNFNLYRWHRHVSLTAHFLGIAPVLVNRAAFDAWAVPVQEAVRAALVEATAAQRGFAIEDDALCLEKLRADGVTIVGPDEIDFTAFRAAVADVV